MFVRLVTIIVIAFFSLSYSQDIPRSAYVLNTLGQNLSVINLENGEITIDAEPLGLFPNQVVVKGQQAYAVNSGVNEIQVIDLVSLTTVDTIDLGSGTNPYFMDFVNDSIAAVSLLFTNELAVMNVNSGEILKKIAVGTGPEGVRYFDGKIYVTNTGFNGQGYDPGTVSVVDVQSLAVVDTIPVNLNPQDADVDAQGRLLIACTGDYGSTGGFLDIIDTGADTVMQSVAANTAITSVRVSSQGKAYLGTYGFGVLVYNMESETFERDVNNVLPGGPAVAFDADDQAYVVDFNNDSLRVFSPAHQLLNIYPTGDGPLSVTLYQPPVTDISENPGTRPRSFQLLQNYPNPFNGQTVIEFQLPGPGLATLEIYNVLGQRLFRIYENEFLPAGRHTVPVAADEFPSGVYFYQLRFGGQQQMKRMTLIR